MALALNQSAPIAIFLGVNKVREMAMVQEARAAPLQPHQAPPQRRGRHVYKPPVRLTLGSVYVNGSFLTCCAMRSCSVILFTSCAISMALPLARHMD